jgi:hypothetical protein
MDPGHFGRIPTILARSDRLLTMAEFRQESGPPAPTTMIGCRRIPELAGSWWSDVAGFRQSDIKRACKDEELNF